MRYREYSFTHNAVLATPQAVHLIIPGRAVCSSGDYSGGGNSGYLMSSQDTPNATLSAGQANAHFHTEYGVCCLLVYLCQVLVALMLSYSMLFHVFVHLDCEARSSLDSSTRGHSTALQLTCVICTLSVKLDCLVIIYNMSMYIIDIPQL